MKEKPKTVGTHNGSFHADEIFAIATLRIIYPKIKIVRTRDMKKLEKLDLRVDVGGKYNPKTGDFDHHQKTFKEKGPTGIPYSSFGLIWKHYGMKICKSKTIWKMIEERLVRFIDAGDNGIEYGNGKMKIYTVGSVIATLFGPLQHEKKERDKKFEEAVKFAKEILRKEIKKGKEIKKQREIVRKAMKNKKQKKYLILPQPGLPKKPLIKDKELEFIIYKREEGTWGIETIPKKDFGFESRKLFPKKWGGLTNEELERATGIKGSVFCHKKLFITIAKDKETAIKLTKKAIETKK